MTPPSTFSATLASVAAHRPDALALVDVRGGMTYAQLLHAVEAEARRSIVRLSGWRRCGLAVNNDISSVVRILGLARAGISPVLLDPGATTSEVDQICRLGRLSGVVTAAGEAVAGNPDDPDDPDAMGAVDATDDPCATAMTLPPGVERGVFGLVSSGTNGLPKLVRRRWSTTVGLCRSFAETASYRPTDVVLATTPIYHSYAFGISLMAGLLKGCTVALAPAPALPSDLGVLLSQLRPTVLQSVPFLYRLLLRTQALPDRSTLRLCLTAGEPVDAATAISWSEAAGVGLSNHYATTETAVVTLAQPGDLETVGRPVRGVTVAVGSADEPTEVLVRTAGPHSSYWGQPALTDASWTGRWQRTGDSGHILADGRLILTGRLSRRLSVAGRKVDPVEVERALRTHPSVGDAYVTSPPTGAAEDGIVAFVEAGPAVSELDLRRHLAARLSPYKVPRRFVTLQAMPRTSTGKIRVPRLWATMPSSTTTTASDEGHHGPDQRP